MTIRERYQMLREFHRRVAEKVSDAPTEPESWCAIMRARLLFEEALELCEALGVAVEVITMSGARINLHDEHHRLTAATEDDGWTPGWTATMFRGNGPVNFTKAVDAMRDLEYVIHGTDLVLGTADAAEETFEEVHRSNMEKMGGSHNGAKAIKPPGWQPPKLAKILRRVFPGQRMLFDD
jgi:predicted HAD superfamily Cof-like phosphohydrolase